MKCTGFSGRGLVPNPQRRKQLPTRNSQDLWIGVSRDLLITS